MAETPMPYRSGQVTAADRHRLIDAMRTIEDLLADPGGQP